MGFLRIEPDTGNVRLKCYWFIIPQEERTFSGTFKDQRLSSEQEVTIFEQKPLSLRFTKRDPFHRDVAEPRMSKELTHVHHLDPLTTHVLGTG